MSRLQQCLLNIFASLLIGGTGRLPVSVLIFEVRGESRAALAASNRRGKARIDRDMCGTIDDSKRSRFVFFIAAIVKE
jgi:hypothetical protein